ncbi:MAG: sugar phosphate isomerase/epimerase [Bacteroides sp.]|nr:sugar phosphate isomerase/epimerase [Prevotella sp.]MCM1407643.1 sugar phosphate isomerase/epimerase [Treponema brennaborense]MCM1469207.1 sugar phosphate isomerase/epimerase [Bacteroides sp.]
MKLCIRPHDVGKSSAAELGKKIKELGFDGVQLAIAKAIEGQNGEPDTLTPAVAKEIADGFRSNGVEIALLGAYFNPVHSNREKAMKGAAKFIDHLKKASLFGTSFVATETGSYNDDKWTYNPKNQTEEAFQLVKETFAPIAAAAENAGAYMVIEGAWHHCMYCPRQLKRLFDELDNGHIRITMDILNYLYIGNYDRRAEIFEEALELFGSNIQVFHLKDFVPENDKLREVPLGQGIMGWDTFLPAIQKARPDAYLVFEGVPDIENSLKYVKSILS